MPAKLRICKLKGFRISDAYGQFFKGFKHLGIIIKGNFIFVENRLREDDDRVVGILRDYIHYILPTRAPEIPKEAATKNYDHCFFTLRNIFASPASASLDALIWTFFKHFKCPLPNQRVARILIIRKT